MPLINRCNGGTADIQSIVAKGISCQVTNESTIVLSDIFPKSGMSDDEKLDFLKSIVGLTLALTNSGDYSGNELIYVDARMKYFPSSSGKFYFDCYAFVNSFGTKIMSVPNTNLELITQGSSYDLDAGTITIPLYQSKVTQNDYGGYSFAVGGKYFGNLRYWG